MSNIYIISQKFYLTFFISCIIHYILNIKEEKWFIMYLETSLMYYVLGVKCYMSKKILCIILSIVCCILHVIYHIICCSCQHCMNALLFVNIVKRQAANQWAHFLSKRIGCCSKTIEGWIRKNREMAKQHVPTKWCPFWASGSKHASKAHIHNQFKAEICLK